MDCSDFFEMNNISSVTNLEGCKEFFLGGAMRALILLGIIIFAIIVLAIYVYTSFAWMTIAKKLKYKRPWLAWIPIANLGMLLQLGKFNWKWIFLILIPILGWIALLALVIVSTWRVFEKRKYPGWLSLIILVGMVFPKLNGIAFIGYFIIIGLVAWKK